MPVWLLLNWKWLASGAVAAIISIYATYYITSMGYRITIADMKTAAANIQTANATASLKQFETDAGLIHDAAVSYAADKTNLAARMDAISKDFANAIKAKPLPLDCKPDADRLRNLAAAIAATNTAAAGSGVGATVPSHP